MHLSLGRWRFSPPLWPTLLALPLLALLLWLGFWQLERAAGKAALLEQFERRGAAAPLQVDQASAHDLAGAAGDLAYRRASAPGRYLSERQYLLDNQVHGGRAGYHVLTPLVLAGEKPGAGPVWVQLVNRGWVPVGPSRARLPAIDAPAGEVTVAGLLGTGRTGALLLGDSGYDNGRWPRVVQRVEYDTIAGQLGLGVVPLVLHLDTGEPGGFERFWPAYRGIGPDRHRAYAFQWFSLALALVVIHVVVNTRRTPRP